MPKLRDTACKLEDISRVDEILHPRELSEDPQLPNAIFERIVNVPPTRLVLLHHTFGEPGTEMPASLPPLDPEVYRALHELLQRFHAE